jgi:glycosyltransferase involved in cell wall biosynthesis
MKISIIIPAQNEEKRIENTLKQYGKFFQNLKKQKILDFEIVIIINNTTDNTEKIVRKFSKKYKYIKYLNFKTEGKGFAIKEGFKYSLKGKNDLIGFVDADMSTSPEDFYDLFKNIKHYDGIIASRWIKGARVVKRTWIRKITSKIFNFVAGILFFLSYKDIQCGAKIFKRKVIEKIIYELNTPGWVFDVNLLFLCKKYKFRIKEHPTVWQDKKESKITDLSKTSIQMLFEIIRLRLLLSKR